MGAMYEIYWFCFAAGAITAVLLILLDNVAGGWIDGMLDALPDFLNPISIMTGVVAFGGTGILLTLYSPLGARLVFPASVLSAIIIAVALFFFYVRPMRQAENSIAYSITELPGKIGEVSVPIPASGYGEASFTFGPNKVYEIASSAEQVEIKAGEKVLAIEVKERVVRVCRWAE